MIFTAVQQNILSNELIVFGKLDKADWVVQDTGYVGDMDQVLFDDPMDFTIKFIRIIRSPITVSTSKVDNAFYVVYENPDYINFDWTKPFVQETINRRIELDRGKAEIHGKSLAGHLHSTD